MQPVRPVPVAVVGVSALFPGSLDAGGFWRDILAGRDLVTDVPPTHWLIEDYYDADPSAPDKTYARRGAFLKPLPFDPMAWGVPPSIVPATDTTQLLALILARQVLDDASRGQFATMDKERISVILGVTSAQELLGTMVSRLQRPNWIKGLRDAGLPEDEVQKAADRISATYVPWQESTFPGLLGNVVAGRIANRLDLGGTNCVTDAACASSFSALAMGLNELYLGQSDLVISGGCDTMNDIFMYMCFSKTPALSPSGDCRPFSDQADGTLLGEGLGMFAIKRLADAERDGDHVYAVIRSVGSSSDGRAKSVYAPVPTGQAKALRRAYAAAGFGPETVELVEAHGTGTKAGDAAEFEGLRMAFDESGRKDRQWCAIGSVKSQIGHTKAAAGAAGLFKAVMALHHRTLPPTVKVERPNPKLALPESPFHVNTVARPWVRSPAHPRRAGVSSFGFGGSNFHVVLEEYTGPAEHAPRHRTGPDEVVYISGADAAAVGRAAAAVAARATCEGMLTRLAWESANGFDPSQPARLTVVASSEADLVAKLQRSNSLMGSPRAASPDGIAWQLGPADGGLAFLFPGQGSQSVGMGSELATAFDEVRAPFDDVADTLGLHDLVWPRPAFDDASHAAQEEILRRTENAQPAIGAVSLGMLALAHRLGLRADATAGHSFGEVVALHAAGALPREHVLTVARARGQRMAAAADATPGAMSAVPLTTQEVAPYLEPGVGVANHNGPRQVVLSGPTEAIAAVEARLLAAGVEPKRLPVATAFHSDVVAGATGPFANDLAGVPFGLPDRPVWCNATAAPYPSHPDAIREGLSSAIARPVRFVEMIEAMYAQGLRVFLELGPGTVLANLVAEILGDRPHVAVSFDRRKRNGWTSLHHALARLAAAGVAIDARAEWSGFAEPVDTASLPKSKLEIPINGANVGKPYPPPGGAGARPRPNPPRPAPEPRIVVQEVVREVPVPHSARPIPSLTTGDSMPPDATWLAAFHETQRATAEAHAAFQRAMADTHLAYLRAMETSLSALTGTPLSASPSVLPGLPTMAAMPSLPPLPPLAGPDLPPVIHTRPAPAAPLRVQSGLDLVAPPSRPAPSRPVADLPATLFAVIADKTGYPPEMLGLQMHLESDLGVDSIKRVEILSALRERIPGLPEVDPAEMGKLSTLGQIVERLGAATGAGALAPPTRVQPVASGPVDVTAALFAVIADKTGYPPEMLGTHMHLESDLGVDSIKRVEILSALRERVPGLPEVDPAEMGKLSTLGQIVDRLGTATRPPSQAPTAPVADLGSVLFSVIADKTGYPAEMLGLHMHLESDLGVDSIKRVEILSAMRDRLPGLPEVDPAEMGKLSTLGEIVARLGASGAAPKSTPKVAAAATSPAVAGPLARFRLILQPTPAAGLAPAGLAGAEITVVGDGQYGPLVAAALCEGGLTARYAAQPVEGGRGLVLLHGLGDPNRADALLEAAFEATHAAASSLSQGGLLVSVQDTGGDFGLSGAAERAWLGGLSGIPKTARIEWPITAKVIDIDRRGGDAVVVAGRIANEILRGGPDLEVGLGADGTRSVLRSVAEPALPGPSPLSAGDVVLVTGGARGVTAATARALAQATSAHVVLLGRTPIEEESPATRGAVGPGAVQAALLAAANARGEGLKPAELRRQVDAVLAQREVRASLDAIAAAGRQATYAALDVTDRAAVEALCSRVRSEVGPIRGLLHGAGVLADKAIADLTVAQWRKVFATKVGGLRFLLDALRDDDLKLVLLFSSVAGRTGNSGQVAYASANEVLNKVAAAEAARRPGAIVRALGWGPWKGGMVQGALEQHFAAMGVPLIPLEAGAQALVDEALDASAIHEVVLGASPDTGLRPDKAQLVSVGVHARRATHAYLGSHVIAGVPVLPVAMAVEWMTRATSAAVPARGVRSFRDIAVRRGARLPGFENGGDWFRLTVEPTDDEARVELRNADDAVLYTAVADLGPRQTAPNAPAEPASAPWTGDVYDGHTLFHGPDFHVLRNVRGLGPEGGVATVIGLREMGWAEDGWKTDPAAVDGGLQVALLWARSVLGGATLPMGVGCVVRYAAGPADGPLTAVLRGERKSRDRAVADVALVDAAGCVHTELRGIELILRPGEPAADA